MHGGFLLISSTLPEIDPDTAYVVCISVSLWFSLYGIRIPLFSLYGIHMPLFPYMVILPIVLGVALLWAAMDFLTFNLLMNYGFGDTHMAGTILKYVNECFNTW